MVEYDTDGRAGQQLPPHLLQRGLDDGRGALHEHQQHGRGPTRDGVLNRRESDALLHARHRTEHALHHNLSGVNVKQIFDWHAVLGAANHDGPRCRVGAAWWLVPPVAANESAVALEQPAERRSRRRRSAVVEARHAAHDVGRVVPLVHRHRAADERLQLRMLAEPLDLARVDVVHGADDLELLELDARVDNVRILDHLLDGVEDVDARREHHLFRAPRAGRASGRLLRRVDDVGEEVPDRSRHRGEVSVAVRRVNRGSDSSALCVAHHDEHLGAEVRDGVLGRADQRALVRRAGVAGVTQDKQIARPHVEEHLDRRA
mmetsp:Transcript_23253/g.77187  ORF Transcript_23253/g.77187 Transcript_23253/m.77187 type:complete len:318 (-) Transcript_23253:1149-2102(-)